MPAALVLFLAGLFILRGVVLLGIFAGLGSPSWALFFDNSFFPLVPPLVIAWLFPFLARRYPSFSRWEVFLNGGLLTGLFWGQGHYGLTLFPHPSWLALAVAVMVLLEMIILLLSSGAMERGRILLFSGLILLLLWGTTALFLGRYAREAVSRGGGLMQPTLFRFDFSRYVKLESEISMSNDLVLLFGSEEPVDRMLLRRYILSGYGRKEGFFLDPRGPDAGLLRLPEGPAHLADPGYLGRDETWQDYYLVNFDPSSFVALNYPVEVLPMKNWGNSSFLRNYRVLSKTASFLGEELGEVPPELPRGNGAYYTDYGEDPEILALAEEIIGEAETNYDKAMALERYLVENYFYSLKPGVASDGNQLHHFLFTSRKGYCSYFAFAMTLMCRSLGIPARVAVGFFVDPSLGVMNIYPIRADMAHAWVEVYFQDYGWISFDPTSVTLAPGEEYNFAGSNPEELLALIEEILANRGNVEEAETEDPAEEPPLSWTVFVQRSLFWMKRYWWALILLLWTGAASFPWLLPWIRYSWTRDNRRRGAQLFRLLVKSYSVRGRGMGRTESVSEWGRRIHLDWEEAGYSSALPGAVALFQRSRYARDFSRRHLLALRGMVRRERRFLRRQTHPIRMIGILLFPWRRR